MILLHRNAVLWLYTALSGREAKYENQGDQTPNPTAAQIARDYLRENHWHWDGPQHYALIQKILDLIEAAEQDTQAKDDQVEHEQAIQDVLQFCQRYPHHCE